MLIKTKKLKHIMYVCSTLSSLAFPSEGNSMEGYVEDRKGNPHRLKITINGIQGLDTEKTSSIPMRDNEDLNELVEQADASRWNEFGGHGFGSGK